MCRRCLLLVLLRIAEIRAVAAFEYALLTVSDPAIEAESATTSLVPESATTYVSYLVTSVRRVDLDQHRHSMRPQVCHAPAYPAPPR
ncbi:hypothetical protein Zm00014a_023000 [Zea mays]|jgi:hypothetical protein|uniref:Secreted protein n=1 Tax=Zea mays TaxID=4577 RepID=A0A3L6DT93_MAIZE|nr:hypothetical protein Zm00014a_023000 [Zea mays]